MKQVQTEHELIRLKYLTYKQIQKWKRFVCGVPNVIKTVPSCCKNECYNIQKALAILFECSHLCCVFWTSGFRTSNRDTCRQKGTSIHRGNHHGNTTKFRSP